jgi:hypothetical protein
MTDGPPCGAQTRLNGDRVYTCSLRPHPSSMWHRCIEEHEIVSWNEQGLWERRVWS